MSWNVGTTEPVPKSQVTALPAPQDATATQREQFNAALLAAHDLATHIGTDQHLVSVSMNGNDRGISITITADHIPDVPDKIPYFDADLELLDDRAAKRLAREQLEVDEPHDVTDDAATDSFTSSIDPALASGSEAPDVEKAPEKGRFGRGKK